MKKTAPVEDLLDIVRWSLDARKISISSDGNDLLIAAASKWLAELEENRMN
jgi:hypothetical protein